MGLKKRRVAGTRAALKVCDRSHLVPGGGLGRPRGWIALKFRDVRIDCWQGSWHAEGFGLQLALRVRNDDQTAFLDADGIS